MSGEYRLGWMTASFAGAAACGLALYAGARVSAGKSAELTVPVVASTSVPITNEQAAESALLNDHFLTVPLSSFGSDAAGLKLGMRLAIQMKSGKEKIGTVVAIRETDLIMSVESSEIVASPSPRR